MVGFCLDTCHAHAGGNALETVVDDVLAITGRIDLVHGNDSRDEFDSGADRHANLGDGRIDPELLAAVIRDAKAPVVLRDARRGVRARRGRRPGCARGSDRRGKNFVTERNRIDRGCVWVGRELAGHVRGSCPAALSFLARRPRPDTVAGDYLRRPSPSARSRRPSTRPSSPRVPAPASCRRRAGRRSSPSGEPRASAGSAAASSSAPRWSSTASCRGSSATSPTSPRDR